MTPQSILEQDRYWLCNAQVPLCLFLPKHCPPTITPNSEKLVRVDIHIEEGMITEICASGDRPPSNEKDVYDMKGGQVWPTFVDIHTHLDKGHIWHRSQNPDGTFSGAIAASMEDGDRYWTADDLYRRMNFALKCSYAHGTTAIRTHLDFRGEETEVTWEVFQTLQQEWQGKIHLQAVSLSTLEELLTPEGRQSIDRLAEMGGILGGMPLMNPNLERQLSQVFPMAKERNLDLDFHTDENLNPEARTLYHVAKTAQNHQFQGQITCGHCCSLAVQPPEMVQETLEAVKAANIAIVSLPLCNLYLQDRQPGKTPTYRGVTLIQEMQQMGIPVMFASDNCRDPFFAFGDHDLLEVFNQTVRIAHLDIPYGNWPQAVTTIPGKIMKLPNPVAIAVGLPANLILFKGRRFTELLARSQHDRIVLRNGQPIDTTLPDYAELDRL
ncbi:cytosine deaminase [Roseofilum sp. BLCC_M91]|uniref:Cytosine deaminase n=1 Tax=Roseofilum halophilum BLCC-M91 TaxID=3022259 RepID=A0ABT7BNN3_9CYAN|nr:cytosine deaminase [Roseofilum halophilum]MDJ1180793.1 cytosine deaminase [Roseofilum halophilum BLCC-M91]